MLVIWAALRSSLLGRPALNFFGKIDPDFFLAAKMRAERLKKKQSERQPSEVAEC
jgi:hypothetical protein